MMSGVLTAALVLHWQLVAETRPRKPTGTDCGDWERDRESGTYHCDDNDSSYRGHYYYGGSYYSNKNNLKNSPHYKSYSNQYKSGIGSGTKGGLVDK